jgi:hypothetical protein
MFQSRRVARKPAMSHPYLYLDHSSEQIRSGRGRRHITSAGEATTWGRSEQNCS